MLLVSQNKDILYLSTNFISVLTGTHWKTRCRRKTRTTRTACKFPPPRQISGFSLVGVELEIVEHELWRLLLSFLTTSIDPWRSCHFGVEAAQISTIAAQEYLYFKNPTAIELYHELLESTLRLSVQCGVYPRFLAWLGRTNLPFGAA